MGVFKSAVKIASINFYRWKRDLRIWFILLFTVLLIDYYLRGIVRYGLESGRTVTICMLPSLFISTIISVNAPKMIFHIGMLLILCDAPFFHPVTPYAVLRSRRTSWWMGECLYIIAAAFFYMLLITLVSSLYVLPVAAFENDWGSLLNSLVFGTEEQTALEVNLSIDYAMAYQPEAVRYLYPFASQLYTFMTGWASFTFLGLLAYVVSLVKKNTALGIGVASVFVFLDPVLTWMMKGRYGWLQAFSLVCWNTVENLNITGRYRFISVPFVAVMYPLLIVILLAVSWRMSKKAVIELKQE